MKKWILVALVIGFVVGMVFAQFAEKFRYHRGLQTDISNPDRLVLVANPTSVTGGDYVLVLNPSSISGGSTVFDDTAPSGAGDLSLHINIDAYEK